MDRFLKTVLIKGASSDKRKIKKRKHAKKLKIKNPQKRLGNYPVNQQSQFTGSIENIDS